MSLPGKQTIGIDFDATIAEYDGWKGFGTITGAPIHGAREAIEHMRKTRNVVIISSRAAMREGIEAIEQWLEKHSIIVDGITYCKECFEFLIDDRAIQFRGVWKDIIFQFDHGFQPWYKKPGAIDDE